MVTFLWREYLYSCCTASSKTGLPRENGDILMVTFLWREYLYSCCTVSRKRGFLRENGDIGEARIPKTLIFTILILKETPCIWDLLLYVIFLGTSGGDGWEGWKGKSTRRTENPVTRGSLWGRGHRHSPWKSVPCSMLYTVHNVS